MARVAVLALLAVALGATSPGARAGEPYADAYDVWQPEPFQGGVTWRVEIDNDGVFHSDNLFTQGASLQKHGPPTHRWEDVGGTMAFGKKLAQWFLPRRRTNLFFREGWILGQNLQTPEELEREDLVADDAPYAASLAVQNSWIAYDDTRLYGFGWLIGVVGPAAMGKPVQRSFHALINADEPRGWDHQLRDELLLNLYYQRKRKVWQAPRADLTTSLGVQAGNYVTGVDLTLETRFGWNLPRGFLYVPDPVGWGLSYDSDLPTRDAANTSFYGSIAARASGVSHMLFLDGNTVGGGPSVPREPFVGSLILGLHYQRPRWGANFQVWLTTDTVDPSFVTDKTNVAANFGSLTIEFRR